MLKIPIHSATDLITNSSTVIFTYSESSEGALKEMIDELFKTFGVNKTCDEIFDTVVLCEDREKYAEYIESLDDEDESLEGISNNIDINSLVSSVEKGETPKPKWFKDVESQEDSYYYYTPSTELVLIPKAPEYEKLAKLVINFLYSTNHVVVRYD